MTPKRLIVAVAADLDDDELVPAAADRRAVAHAQVLAVKSRAELRLVHAIDFVDSKLAPGYDVHPIVEAMLSPHLQRLCDDAVAAGVQASYIIRAGRADRVLAGEAESSGADVIVASPRRNGISFGDRLKHGSTARRLLQHAPCDVWIVAPSAAPPIHRMLALVDLSDVSDQVVKAANGLAEATGAERLALHCLHPPGDIVMHLLPEAREALARYNRSAHDEAERDLEQLTGGVAAGWTCMLCDGWVVRKAPLLVEREHLDLIVVAGGSLPSLAGVLLGTTVERLLDRTAASTWVVRSRREPVAA